MIYVLCDCDPATGCLLFVGVVGSCRVALAGPPPRTPHSPVCAHTPAAPAPPGAAPRRSAAATGAFSPVEWVPPVYRRSDTVAPPQRKIHPAQPPGNRIRRLVRTPQPRQRPQGPNRGDWRRPPAPPECPAHLWSGFRRCTYGVTPQRRPSTGYIRPYPPETELIFGIMIPR